VRFLYEFLCGKTLFDLPVTMPQFPTPVFRNLTLRFSPLNSSTGFAPALLAIGNGRTGMPLTLSWTVISCFRKDKSPFPPVVLGFCRRENPGFAFSSSGDSSRCSAMDPLGPPECGEQFLRSPFPFSPPSKKRSPSVEAVRLSRGPFPGSKMGCLALPIGPPPPPFPEKRLFPSLPFSMPTSEPSLLFVRAAKRSPPRFAPFAVLFPRDRAIPVWMLGSRGTVRFFLVGASTFPLFVFLFFLSVEARYRGPSSLPPLHPQSLSAFCFSFLTC